MAIIVSKSLPDDLFKTFKSLCGLHGKTITEELNAIIKEYVEEHVWELQKMGGNQQAKPPIGVYGKMKRKEDNKC